MKIPALLLLAAGVLSSFAAGAYCIHNEVRGHDVFIEQEQLKDRLREDRELRVTLKPGQKHCCFNLDCNPGGRPESPVTLGIRVLGDPEYVCGAPEGSDTIKVSGNGVVRIVHNPRPKSAFPYAIKIRSNDRNVFGPNGLQCLPRKGKP
jgi:hypothetical protein